MNVTIVSCALTTPATRPASGVPPARYRRTEPSHALPTSIISPKVTAKREVGGKPTSPSKGTAHVTRGGLRSGALCHGAMALL